MDISSGVCEYSTPFFSQDYLDIYRTGQERRFNKITGLRSSLSFILEELRPPPGRTSHKGSISVASIFIAVWVFFNLVGVS